MHIIGNEKLVKFQQKHSNVKSSLDHWTKLIEEGNFRSVVELRQKFPHADLVPGRPGQFDERNKRTKLTVFNIGGNKARLTAFLQYKKQRLIIIKIETHAKYDRRI